jgi:hypothetical protein
MADEIPSTGEERPHTKALGGGEAGAGEVYQDPKSKYQFHEKDAGKWYADSGMPVNPAEGFKATEIRLFSVARPHMRAFHFAWLSFFCAFVCWFAFAPLMVLVKADLELNLSQVFTTNILSVAGTVFCRFAIGPLCDKVGPKICQFSLLSWIAVFTLLGMSVNSFWSLCIVRFCIGAGGAAFVVTQYWTTTMFANNIVGTANATTAGWGNLGGGVTQMLMVGVYSFMRNVADRVDIILRHACRPPRHRRDARSQHTGRFAHRSRTSARRTAGASRSSSRRSSRASSPAASWRSPTTRRAATSITCTKRASSRARRRRSPLDWECST